MNYRQLPEITNKQKQILNLIYKFRFINRKQLQRYLLHKDARRINEWLRDLVKKNYLGRIYSRRLLENTKPAIYHLSNNGILWVRYEKGDEYGREEGLDFKYLKKFYEDRNASLTFINHCITLFEFYLQLKEAEREANKDFIKKRKKLKDFDEDFDKELDYVVQTKTEMWIYNHLHLRHNEDWDEIKHYIPDLYWEKLLNPENGKMNSHTVFLELFDPKLPRYVIKYKIKKYIELKEEGNWKHKYTGINGNFPLIILVFPNQGKLNFMSGFIKDELLRAYEPEKIVFYLTTYQKAMTGIVNNPNIWKEIREE